MTVINASAAATLLEQRKNSGSEWDSNPQPLRPLVVSNSAQSLNFLGLCFSSVVATFALMSVITQLLLQILN